MSFSEGSDGRRGERPPWCEWSSSVRDDVCADPVVGGAAAEAARAAHRWIRWTRSADVSTSWSWRKARTPSASSPKLDPMWGAEE